MLDFQRQAARFAGAQWLVPHERPDALHHLRDGQQTLDAREIDAGVVDEPLDRAQPLDFVWRVDAHAPDRAARLNQPEAVVLTKSLRMHAEHPRRHADQIEVVHPLAAIQNLRRFKYRP